MTKNDLNKYMTENPDFKQWSDELCQFLERKRPHGAGRFEVKVGLKFIKIIYEGSAWGFVVIHDGTVFKGHTHIRGDLLKPASFATPAAKSRGNIYDGTARYSEYGPEYLRK